MSKKSIDLLNKAVADELSAIHQYMYFHFHCEDQGFDLFSNLFKRTAIDEMAHAEKLAERILFLKGEVHMYTAYPVEKIKDVKNMLELAAKMEKESARRYNQCAIDCSANSDSISKQLFESLVAEEEKHFNRFDTELKNIEMFGANYLALQSIERSKLLTSAK